MPKARHVYQAIVRSAMSYGAAVWHQPAKGKAKGLAAKLQKQQRLGLQAVLGAFKATSTRRLETESYVPPLDLWLHRRIARFQARLEHSRMAQKIRDACNTIRNWILRRTSRQRSANIQLPTPGTKRRLWVEEWIDRPLEQWDWQEKKLVLRDWEERWHTENKRLGRIIRPSTDLRSNRIVPEDPPPTKQVLELHKDLRKAESALLVQARTRHIGLAKFLYSRKIPGIVIAQCQCIAGHETARHMALFCTKEAGRRQYLQDNVGRA